MTTPICKVCDVLLIVGQNITKSRLKQCQYFCGPHWLVYRKTHRTIAIPAHAKEYHIVRHFQLSRADWEKMYESQNGRCGMCGAPLVNFLGEGEGQTPVVDHDHKTGLIRGLLCQWPCNRVLGLLRDNVVLCRGAAAYLECPPATTTFGSARFTIPGRIGTKKRTKLLRKLKNS